MMSVDRPAGTGPDPVRVRTARPASPAEVAAAAQLACLLEASAPKPGNVSPGRHFADTRYEHFLASAAAIGAPLAGAGTRGLGATIRLAVEATARWTTTNTNLGIVLLLAPIARAVLVANAAGGGPRDAAADTAPAHGAASRNTAGWQRRLRAVLAETTVDDAREVYAAIRLAAPGGLGRVAEQDVAEEPTAPLADVMALAAARDGIACEYATAFDVTCALGVPALTRALDDGLTWSDAVVELFLTLLSAAPDTHIARRAGGDVAADVTRRARAVLDAGGVRSEAGRQAVDAMDRALRDPRNHSNPGTTADLTAAAIFVALLDGRWNIHPGGTDAAAR